MNIYKVMGGDIPAQVGEWCSNKANQLSGLDRWGNKQKGFEPTARSFLLSSFLKPFGYVLEGLSYKNVDDSFFAVLTPIVCGIAAVGAGVVVGITAAPTMGIAGAIGVGLVTPVLSYPVLHLGSILGMGLALAGLNAAIVGNVGAAVIAAKSYIKGKQPTPAPQPAPQATVQTPAQPVAPKVDGQTVMDYIASLPQAQQDALVHGIKDKFPALVERTLKAEWMAEQVELSTPRVLTVPDVKFRGKAATAKPVVNS